jgi:N-glycosylase/DNA lyase
LSGELETTFEVTDYDLAQTLASGQAFRWQPRGASWVGVVMGRWVKLHTSGKALSVRLAAPVENWAWLQHYLQINVRLADVLSQFPQDSVLSQAVAECRGLRLLRQEPWECLASFILSSTKQIVQIQQVISHLCREFGEPVPVPPDESPAWSFPCAERLANATELQLRRCKMGFRAPYLLETARAVASRTIRLEELSPAPLEQARAQLMLLPGVGRKIADCVLLFGLGFDQAFPVDVWILRGLRELYFPKQPVKPGRLRTFADTHFGACAGYAQQYLFHYLRTRGHRSGIEES